MTSCDQFPVPVRSAVKTNVPACQVLGALKYIYKQLKYCRQALPDINNASHACRYKMLSYIIMKRISKKFIIMAYGVCLLQFI